MLAAVDFDLIAILSRVLHTTCGATLLGGLVYLRFVLSPAAAAGQEEDVCFAGRRGAWAACVGICSGLLLLSGGYNFWVVLTQYDKPPSPYHALIGVKILLALVVFVLAALIAGKTNAARRIRQRLALWLNLALACTLAIFLLGAMLRDIPKTRKAIDAAPPRAAAQADSSLHH